MKTFDSISELVMLGFVDKALFIFGGLFLLPGPILSILDTIRLGSGDLCYYDTDILDGNCYRVSLESKSWTRAWSECSAIRGRLPVTDGEYSVQSLCRIAQEAGLSSVWLDGTKMEIEWTWINDVTLAETGINFWSSADNDRENHDCAAIIPTENYLWSAGICGSGLGYICETEATAALCFEAANIFTEVLVADGMCFMLMDDAVSWFQAEKVCQRYGANLARITSQTMQDRFTSAQPMLSSGVAGYWIGLTKARWFWETEGIQENFWADEEPNGSGDCLQLSANDSSACYWHDQSCSSQQQFACVVDILTALSPSPSTSPFTTPASTTATPTTPTPTATTTRLSTTSTATPTATPTLPTTTATTTTAMPTTTPTLPTSIPTTPTTTTPSPTTSTSAPLSEVGTICHPVDICWIIDSSSSEYLNLYKQFIKDVVNNLDVGGDCYQISVINMGENVIDEFYLDTFADRMPVLNAIDFITSEGNPVDIQDALQIARVLIFNRENGDRDGAPNVAILMTHSSPLMDVNNVRVETSYLKGNGIVLFPIVLSTSAETLAHYQTLSSSNTYFLPIESMLLSSSNIRYVLDILQDTNDLTQIIESQINTANITQPPPSENLPRESKNDDIDHETLIIILVTVIVAVLILLIVIATCVAMYVSRKNKLKYRQNRREAQTTFHDTEASTEHLTTQSEISIGSTRSAHSRYSSKSAKSTKSYKTNWADRSGAGPSGITTPWGSMKSDKRPVRPILKKPVDNMAI